VVSWVWLVDWFPTASAPSGGRLLRSAVWSRNKQPGTTTFTLFLTQEQAPFLVLNLLNEKKSQSRLKFINTAETLNPLRFQQLGEDNASWQLDNKAL